jgi:hypothetical protein
MKQRNREQRDQMVGGSSEKSGRSDRQGKPESHSESERPERERTRGSMSDESERPHRVPREGGRLPLPD